MEGVSPPTGLSYNGQSNMRLTIAAIMSQESNTTVNLWGDDDNFTHMNVYINGALVMDKFAFKPEHQGRTTHEVEITNLLNGSNCISL